MIDVYNYPKTLAISKKKFVNLVYNEISRHFQEENISVIFVTEKEIRELNKRYREIDTSTDVLSFNYNTVDLLGEVYISLDYIVKNRKEIDLLEEVLRISVHGILHLYGYDHKSEFTGIMENDKESMFVLQESILNEILKKK